MQNNTINTGLQKVLNHMPSDWLRLTTHRLDIYDESKAKVQFLEELESLLNTDLSETDFVTKLNNLPTAFDYIRLGHPLSCVLEWMIANKLNLSTDNIIAFASETMPLMAILRENHINSKETQVYYSETLPTHFDKDLITKVYGYKFSLTKVDSVDLIKESNASTIYLNSLKDVLLETKNTAIDFVISFNENLGSIATVLKTDCANYINQIQHVRRRESIAMTPQDSLKTLNSLVSGSALEITPVNAETKNHVTSSIQDVANTKTTALLGSSGLSVQYAIMMGLVQNSLENHAGKNVKFIVPGNCYGGTNDQARRVAACLPHVDIVDLAVDSGKNMVDSLEVILNDVALEDAVPYIIAEIPTNPRVEVPDLIRLKETLGKVRKTNSGTDATAPVFILDQTFCPNVKFLGEGDYLDSVQTIAYVSGSKFPSGGLCTAGYCIANEKANSLMSYIDTHLKICTNEATAFQIDTLEKQMPSMVQRIADAYKGTRGFVTHMQNTLPDSKINFVSEELASQDFTPSVFSLDLPTIGETHEEREAYKRDLNLKLINLMIERIPTESKYCVSYGQLKGCYWTIPATSTQGTTKEGDKDYIVRVAVSPDFDLEKHKAVFSEFCEKYIK